MTLLFERSSRIARCSAAESTRSALRRAVGILVRNRWIPQDVPVLLNGANCRDLAVSWKECVSEILSRITREDRVWRVASALKSCSRLFDRRCESCDALSSREAIDSWLGAIGDGTTMGSLGFMSPDVILVELKKRLRILVSGWGSRLVGERKECVAPAGANDVYFPDQQGCYEASRASGGTMSVCTCCKRSSRPNQLRVACAKTKGKNRVVTVQPAHVKRVLRPVHSALYDHISSFGWCVRGEVTSEDFFKVALDRRDGESFISGDYSSATDKLFLPVVQAAVEVLLEDPHLLPEEREILWGSFTDLECYTGPPCNLKFAGYVRRGQMMGNLVSFPLLCLLNKVCFDLSCDISYGLGTSRIGRFNGDDCLFPGDRRFYETWQRVTAAFGFVVNPTKTGFSARFGELNSRCFDYNRGRFLPKVSLSFLRPVERNGSGDILPSILSGIEHLRFDVQLWIVNSLMRHEISLREISLGPVPRRWQVLLLRRRWFRDALHRGSAPVVKKGDDRSLPVKLGPLPRPGLYNLITRLGGELAREHVDFWTGRVAAPYSSSILRGSPISPLPRSPYLTKVVRTWSFLWPRSLLDLVPQNPHWLLPPSYSRRKWIDDHPFLVSRCEAVTGDLRLGKVSHQAVPDPTLTGYLMGEVVFCER